MTREEKGKLVLQFVTELVEETRNDKDDIGGFMRVFGEEYILRMETFASLFEGK